MMKKRGVSYAKRVADINRIYDTHAHSGLSNREIWRRFVWPTFGVSERTFYNVLRAAYTSEKVARAAEDYPSLFDFNYE